MVGTAPFTKAMCVRLRPLRGHTETQPFFLAARQLRRSLLYSFVVACSTASLSS
jgi:hypothetical protein